MSIPVEVTVTIKGSDSTYRQKFLCYDKITLEESNHVIGDCIREAKESYKGDIDEVKIRTSMVWFDDNGAQG